MWQETRGADITMEEAEASQETREKGSSQPRSQITPGIRRLEAKAPDFHDMPGAGAPDIRLPLGIDDLVAVARFEAPRWRCIPKVGLPGLNLPLAVIPGSVAQLLLLCKFFSTP